MTSELTSETPRAESSAPSLGAADRGDHVVRLHLRIALLFLSLGTALYAIASAGVLFPDAFADIGPLSYGRLAPAAFDLVAFGWLTIGLIGAGFHILPRVSGRPLAHQRMAVFGGGLVALGVLSGAIAIVFGANEGRQYLEFPIWSDAIIVAGLLAVVRVFTATIAGDRESTLAPSEWFFGSAPVWLLLAHVVGNIPGLVGVNSALQTSFYRGALFGMWFATASVGVVYYLVSRLTGRDPRRITQLVVIGFWSLGFVYALSSASRLTYTAAPDWVETLGGVFSIALFLPVAIIVVDVAASLRGIRSARGRATLRLVVAGTAAFAVVPVVNVSLSMRSSSAIVGMTDWVTALDVLAVFGGFTLWLLAFVHHVSVPSGRGAGHYRTTVLAAAVLVGSLLVGGLQTGLGWVASANAGEVSAGDSFQSTVAGIEGQLWVRFLAVALFALAQVALVSMAWRAREGAVEEVAADSHPEAASDDATGEEAEADGAEADEDLAGLPPGDPVTLSRLRTGTVGIFVAVAAFVFGFPVLEEAHVEGTPLGDEVRNYAVDEAARGRAVYLAEGCWYCHTQEVREIVTDVGLGPVAQPGDYAHEAPTTAGVARAGPDLMFAASRGLTRDAVRDYLADPRGARSWATMPGYGYLSTSDLDAVATYIASLRSLRDE